MQHAQYMLFAFLGAVAAGTFAGGPIGDRFGRKPVIWFSILGAFPFALMLPYADLMWTGILSVRHRPDPGLGVLRHHRLCAGIAARPDWPGGGHDVRLFVRPRRAGRGGAGRIADVTGIETVYRVCSFLPLIGLLTALLPNIERRK